MRSSPCVQQTKQLIHSLHLFHHSLALPSERTARILRHLLHFFFVNDLSHNILMFVVNKMIEIPIKREEQRYAFSFQSAKQNPNFFSRKYKDFLPLKTDGMIIKQMQKSSRYSTRFMLKSHACRWIEGCTKMRRKNCKFGDSKRGMHVLFLKKSFHLFVKIRKKKLFL